MPINTITILPENRIIIRTPSVWYMITIRYANEQRQFSKNPVFERAYKLAKKKYGDRYEEQ